MKIIHINNSVIASNRQNATQEPPITVIARDGATRMVSRIDIVHLGETIGALIYDPVNPHSGVFKCWLELDENVDVRCS